jgi:hypothetical protein
MDSLSTVQIPLAQAVLYGNCVDAAYTVYQSTGNNLNPPVSVYPKFIQDNYQLVFNIQMTDFFFFNQTPSYYGFIAKSRTAPYNYVVALRGTLTWEEWFDDFDDFPTAFERAPNGGHVASGFYTIFQSLTLNVPGKGPANLKLIDAAAEPTLTFDDAGKVPVVVAGHSLGAALATMYAAYMANSGPNGQALSVFTYASPKVGDSAFAAMYNKAVPENYRIYNKPDIVPHVPLDPDIFDPYDQVAGGYQINSRSYKSVRHSLECYHSLKTYLFVLGGGVNPNILAQNCKA